MISVRWYVSPYNSLWTTIINDTWRSLPTTTSTGTTSLNHNHFSRTWFLWTVHLVWPLYRPLILRLVLFYPSTCFILNVFKRIRREHRHCLMIWYTCDPVYGIPTVSSEYPSVPDLSLIIQMWTDPLQHWSISPLRIDLWHPGVDSRVIPVWNYHPDEIVTSLPITLYGIVWILLSSYSSSNKCSLSLWIVLCQVIRKFYVFFFYVERCVFYF